MLNSLQNLGLLSIKDYSFISKMDSNNENCTSALMFCPYVSDMKHKSIAAEGIK